MKRAESKTNDGVGRVLWLFIVVLLLAFPTVSLAGYVGNNIAIATKAYDQQNPHTIYLSDPVNPDNGLWFVVWEDWRNQTTTGSDIYGRFIDMNGNPCGSELVITNATGNQTVPRAAYQLSEGKILVVWQDTRANYVYYRPITVTDFTACTATLGAPATPGYSQIKEYDYSTLSTDDALDELIAIGDGVTTSFTDILTHKPIVPGTVQVTAGAQSLVDNGQGGFIGGEGSINYNSGSLSVKFGAAPGNTVQITVDYTYLTSFPPGKMDVGDTLRSRQLPRIAYDPTGDRFWIVWKETRSILHQFSQLCFASRVGSIASWEFDDSDFIGYVRLDANTLAEQSSLIGTPGADIIRNMDTGTVRLVTTSAAPLKETRVFESFNLATHPDVSCDTTSTQCLIVFEGVRMKQTLTCDCIDNNKNNGCDLADVVSDSLTSSAFDDGFVHIYGISDNYIPLSVVSSMKLDSSNTNSYYPSVGFDQITKRFLTAWEDLRGGANTKIYGQLVLSGGGKYNSDFIISYQDTNGDGQNDANVVNSRQTKPFVSYDPVNQRFFVIWQDGRNSTLSLENLDIYGQKVDAEGSLRGNNYAIFTLSYNQYIPTIAYNDVTNQFLTVWKDARNTDKNTCGTSIFFPKPCGSDVYGQRFTLAQPSLTLLKPDNTPLTPPLLTGFENPIGTGIVEVGQSNAISFKIRNTGDTILKIDYINEDLSCNGTAVPNTISPFSFDGLPSQLMYRDGNTIDLVPGAEIALTVRFTPTAGGSFNKCFVIESDGGMPQVNLSALATEPNITVTPTSHNFGGVFIGSFGERTFVVKNTGTASLMISSLNKPLAPFSIKSDGDGCGGRTVAPGATCNIVARFTPMSVNTFNSQLGINSTDPDTPLLNVALSGAGVGAADITVTPVDVNFGNIQVEQFGTRTVTVKNDGTATLTINSITGPVAPFSITGNTCLPLPLILDIGSSCQITVRFAPFSVGGTSSSVVISSSDPDEGTVTVNLTGTGVILPDIRVNPAFVNFPSTSVVSSSQQNITVSNVGTATLNIAGFTNPAGEFSIFNSDCVASLEPTQSCTITIAFSPKSAGFKTASFAINSNDPDTPAFTVSLSGVAGVLPDITAPTVLNFGSRLMGTTTDLSITVSNSGSGPLSITSVSSPAAPFSIQSDNCSGASVPAGGSCQMTVRFAPNAVGPATSSIVIASDDPDEATVTVNLNGTGIKPADIVINGSDPLTTTVVLNFGVVKVGRTSTSQRITLRNGGGTDLVISSIQYPGTPFRTTSDGCRGRTLAGGAECFIDVVFNPTRAVTYNPYYITITTNDPDIPKARVTLQGRGTW